MGLYLNLKYQFCVSNTKAGQISIANNTRSRNTFLLKSRNKTRNLLFVQSLYFLFTEVYNLETFFWITYVEAGVLYRRKWQQQVGCHGNDWWMICRDVISFRAIFRLSVGSCYTFLRPVTRLSHVTIEVYLMINLVILYSPSKCESLNAVFSMLFCLPFRADKTLALYFSYFRHLSKGVRIFNP